MKRSFALRLTAIMVMVCMTLFVAAPAFAYNSVEPDRVLMTKPHADAAVVANFESGFKNVRYKTFTGATRVLNEGLVIRQSRIEDGKIIIPKSGLYYTTRTSPLKMLQGEKTMILGKEYTIVDSATRIDVLTNVEIKKGQSVPFGDETKRLEVSSISMDSNGFDAARATLQILKPSGNYYGTAFPAATDSKLIDITKGKVNKGTGKTTGSYLPGEKGYNWHVEYYDTPIAVSGQTYLVTDAVTKDSVKVKEFATGAFISMLMTDQAPVEMVLGKGESAVLGDYTVKVTAVGANTATVELVSKKGEVTKKVLGPVTEETTKYLPADEVNRNKMQIRPASDDVQVQLDLYREPFRNGKVALVGYTGLVKVNNPDKWYQDGRFIARPDT